MSRSESAQAQLLIQKCAGGNFFQVGYGGRGPGIFKDQQPSRTSTTSIEEWTQQHGETKAEACSLGRIRKQGQIRTPFESHNRKKQPRLNAGKAPPHEKTQPDHYDVRHKDTMLNKAKSARAFPRQNHVQDLKRYVKSQTVNRAFNRDFTRSGSCLAF